MIYLPSLGAAQLLNQALQLLFAFSTRSLLFSTQCIIYTILTENCQKGFLPNIGLLVPALCQPEKCALNRILLKRKGGGGGEKIS